MFIQVSRSKNTTGFSALCSLLMLASTLWLSACGGDKPANPPAAAKADSLTTAIAPLPNVLDTTSFGANIPDGAALRVMTYARKELDSYAKTLTANAKPATGNPPAAEAVTLYTVDTLLRAGKFRNYIYATQLLEKIQSGNPYGADALKRLAFCKHKTGDQAGAIAAYEKYAALAPANAAENDWVLCLYYMADYAHSGPKCLEKLQKIGGGQGPYRQKAVDLNNDLQSK